MSPRHCVATSVLRNYCCFNCSAEQSHKDTVCSTTVAEQLKQKKYNFLSLAPPPSSWSLLGSLEGPAPLDLTWTRKWKSNVFVRVQLTSLFLISAGPRGTVNHKGYKIMTAKQRGRWSVRYNLPYTMTAMSGRTDGVDGQPGTGNHDGCIRVNKRGRWSVRYKSTMTAISGWTYGGGSQSCTPLHNSVIEAA